MDDALYNHAIAAANSIVDSKTIFKYVNHEVGVKILENRSIAFSRPDSFNDPFDCSPELLKIDANATRVHMSGAFARMLGNNYEEWFRLKHQLNKATDAQVEALAKNGLSSEYTHRGVTCFSTKFDEILMWAHYCTNHSGVCIGFDTIKLYKYLRYYVEEIGYFAVNYVDQLDKQSLYPANSEAILYMLKTKSRRWSYEDEVRITGTKFRFNKDHLHLVELPSELFTDLYVGINVDDESSNSIVRMAEALNPAIRVYKMHADYAAFSLVSTRL